MQNFINELKEFFGDKDKISLHEPNLDSSDEISVTRAMRSGFVSSVGASVTEFERSLENYTGAKHCLSTVNGTAALHLALMAVGVSQSDLVITQSLTFVATANAISYCGAAPIFVDIDKNNYGMCPKSLEKFLVKNCMVKSDGCFHKGNGKKIKAVVPMHTFGTPCNIKQISEICKNWKIFLIEDAAEAIGSFVGNKMCGTFGHLGVISFNGNKLITTGGGGAVLTSSKEFNENVRHLATTAKVPHSHEFLHDQVAFNYRMPNLNAALGCSQLAKIQDLLKAKSKFHNFYTDIIKRYDMKLVLQKCDPDCSTNNWLFSIKCETTEIRDKLVHDMLKSGINVRIPWRPMHLLPMFNKCQTSDLFNTIEIYHTVINLPSSPWSK